MHSELIIFPKNTVMQSFYYGTCYRNGCEAELHFNLLLGVGNLNHFFFSGKAMSE